MALEVDGIVKWVNGDGHSTKFWKDNWILNCDVLADNFFGNGRNLGESDPPYAKWFLGNCLPMLSVDIEECHQMIYARDVCQPERCLCMFYGTAEKCKNSGTKLLNLIIRAYFLASKYMIGLSEISLAL
ncbi:hypothetical protein MTR_5g015700 [Medicago truncatula]|uniref:Uncharacterized protein n=1 Tax=Medicago truncatula TaxID=3880 RepID=G7K3T7_MEDTR|nr:hypothetical protein MTR_5g015700 [Medicago truncatula]